MAKREYPGSMHNHTDTSNLRLRDSINKLDDLVSYALELGHTCIAITEHESLSNSVKIEKLIKKTAEKNPDFKIIRGNEIYLCRNGLTNENFDKEYDRYYHFILLAKDAIGHQQIREISTRAWMRSYMARGMRRVPTYYQDLFDIIATNPGHVIGSTACLGGALPTQLLRHRESQDEELYEKIGLWIEQMKSIFGEDNFYFELQPSHHKDQIYVNKKLITLSKEHNVPYIITTDSHYLKKEDRLIHKAYLNAQDGDREVDDFYATTYLMGTEELEGYLELTDDQLEFAYSNIQKIADMCENYKIARPLKIPKLMWKKPEYSLDPCIFYDEIPWLKTFVESDYDGDKVLAQLIVERIANDSTLQNKETYKEIDSNLKTTWISSEVNKTHWSAYFLNLQRIIDECWEAGTIVGCGRGSGVGFMLLYILGITQINPLRETTKTVEWRFLNPERVSVLDVDVDIEGGRRKKVLDRLREVYGQNRVANVATFGTEKAKSAILTACRGLGIDVDIAQYLASMIESDRGIQRTLSQTFYGDEENGFAPNKQFVIEMTENYPEVWEVAKRIEGLICRLGEHAGGIIFVDEPFTNSTALMRAPNGDIMTQFELHDAEEVSLIKYDLLSVEGLDKIHNCIDLICDYGFEEREDTLKETYEKMIGIYNLERYNPKMWEMVWDHKVMSLFQMEKQSGIQGIALTKPQSVDDLATLNSVIRLMAQEKGGEQPLNKYARFKEDISLWYEEMDKYGLTKKEQKILEPIIKISYGMCESQERFMQLVQLPECGGFSLTWADKLRKSIAKKNPAEYDKLTKEFFEITAQKGCSRNFCSYVWNVLVATSKGYGFNLSHTLAYSLIALQEMNLAFKYPTIFWNTACLITDSGGGEDNDEETIEEDTQGVFFDDCGYESDGISVIDFVPDDPDDDDATDEETSSNEKITKDKKKTRSVAYGKIASAIGKMAMSGINVTPPDINASDYTFSPDVEESVIRYGLSGIVKVGEDLIQNIINNRPYTSMFDFLDKVKVNKTQMVNLIKSGAFDAFGDREELMKTYVETISDQKKRVTLQNMKMLIEFDLLPEELDYQKKLYYFNKYIKKAKYENLYLLDEFAFEFFEKNYSIDNLRYLDDKFGISQVYWDAIYKKGMEPVRVYLKAHSQDILNRLNNRLIEEVWNKYCCGSISKWEMDSVCFYSHDHELKALKPHEYGIEDFYNLSSEPVVDRIIPIKGKQVPIFKLYRIAGTVLDKDKSKKTVTLLTKSGVVTVKIFGPVFTNYDKQISEKGADGKKHVCEKSWFTRGNKIVVTGMRRDDMFVAKKYSKTPYHLVEKILEIKEDGTLITQGERYGESEE